jgi:hypothetical protein
VSLTPTDRPDGRTEPPREHESEREATLWSRCRAVVARACERVRSRLSGHDASDPPLPDHAAAPPECPPVGSLPARSLPLTYPTRARDGDNGSDLRVERDGDSITLSHPAAEDARIESDTWVPVEQ